MIHYPPGYDVKAKRAVNHHYLYPLDPKSSMRELGLVGVIIALRVEWL